MGEEKSKNNVVLIVIIIILLIAVIGLCGYIFLNKDNSKSLDYNIENICVKHNDIGELYYNFIGGKWDVGIKKLNIDILLPNNKSKENLYAFGHGPYNGVVTIESPNKVNFKVNNVKKRSVCCC